MADEIDDPDDNAPAESQYGAEPDQDTVKPLTTPEENELRESHEKIVKAIKDKFPHAGDQTFRIL